MLNIENIDVVATVKGVIGNPYAIEAIVIGFEEEAAGLPVETPPEVGSFEELVWITTGQMSERDYWLKEAKAEKLLGFLKLPENKQQKILHRAVIAQKRYFFAKSPLMKLLYKGDNL